MTFSKNGPDKRSLWDLIPYGLTPALMIAGLIGFFSFKSESVSRQFTSQEMRVETEAYMQRAPTELDNYLQAIRQDSIARAFLQTKDTMLKRQSATDSIARLNATTIYQMKQDQKEFFKALLREMGKN